MAQEESNDKVWAELNDKLLAAMQRNDWDDMRTIYYDQALLLKKEERDSFRFLEESIKSEIYYDHEQDIEKVEILTLADSCPECRAKDGMIFTISEVLEQAPVPSAKCEKETCRCSYAPLVQVRPAPCVDGSFNSDSSDL